MEDEPAQCPVLIPSTQLTYCPHAQTIHTKVTTLDMTGPISPKPQPIVPFFNKPLAGRVRYEDCLNDHVEPINHMVVHVENHMKPQDGKRRGKCGKCAAMDTCHGLRRIAIDLPNEVWACSVGPERIDEFTDRGLQHV